MKILISDDSKSAFMALKYSVVESFKRHRDLYESGIEPEFFYVDRAGKVLDAIKEHDPDVILLDLMYPDSTEENTISELLPELVSAGVPVIVVSGSADVEMMKRIMQLGADDFVSKSEIGQVLHSSMLYKLIYRAYCASDFRKQTANAIGSINDLMKRIE